MQKIELNLFKGIAILAILMVIILVLTSTGCINSEGIRSKPQIKTEAWVYPNSEDQLIDNMDNPYLLRIYDRHGNVIYDNRCFYVPCNPEWLFEYDDTGNIIRFTWIELDSPTNHSETYQYDDQGRILAIVSDNAAKTRRFSRTYAYDDEGNLIENTYTSGLDDLVMNFTYEYDEEGNSIVTEEQNGISWISATIKYDEKGNEIEYTKKGHGLPFDIQIATKYDDMGNILQQSKLHVFGILQRKPIFLTIYNDAGDEMKTTYWQRNSEDNFTYSEFDEFNNWVKRTITSYSLEDGEKTREDIFYRIFTYY